MKRLAIIGAGELGCLIAHHAIAGSHYDVVGYYDDRVNVPQHSIGDLSVLGKTEQAFTDFDKHKFNCLMIGVGYASMTQRKHLFDLFAERIPMGSVVHGSCSVDPSVEIGAGVFLMPGCVVDLGVTVGDNVTCQVGSVIAHHSNVRNHALLGPGVKLAGYVDVGEMSFLGTGSVSSDSLKIGERCVIGAGAVVIDDIPARSVAVGVPAKVIKRVQ